jgi:hypothetical protein
MQADHSLIGVPGLINSNELVDCMLANAPSNLFTHCKSLANWIKNGFNYFRHTFDSDAATCALKPHFSMREPMLACASLELSNMKRVTRPLTASLGRRCTCSIAIYTPGE